MWESRSVDVVVQLPESLANHVREVREEDPEYLSRIIKYGLARRAFFHELCRSLDENQGEASGGASRV